MLKKINKVKINYDSGNSVTAWFDLFKLTSRPDDSITGFKYNLSFPKRYGIVHLGYNKIESVEVVKRGYRFIQWRDIKKLFR